MIATLPRVSRHRTASAPRDAHVLQSYRGPDGVPREVIVLAAAAGSTLVLDRAGDDATDSRLVAHLAADEPPINASVVCARYVADRRASRGCALPRSLREEDLLAAPLPDPSIRCEVCPAIGDDGLVDQHGARHRLAAIRTTTLGIPEFRWLREPTLDAEGPAEIVSVRDVIGALEDYEPARTLTDEIIRGHGDDPSLSVAVLRSELARVAASPIILNRRLRERVVRTLAREGMSMSEIAVRCGRVKRDRRGNVSGETSWLARRLGLLPEGGERVPTPWIHSEVLALIARRGLGLCPREVEL